MKPTLSIRGSGIVRSLALPLAIATTSLLAGCSLGTRSSPAGSLVEFENGLERLRHDLRIPGMSAAIVHGQRIVWARGFGYANVEDSIPAADTTAYHLASLTKTFASTIVMELVETGQLDLEAPVADFGIVLPGSGVVRVKHLLTHTSEGIPGSRFAYNGNRFGLLDQVILTASGESFGQRLERLILRPLHLAHTAPNILVPPAFNLAGLDAIAFQRNLAQGYSSDGTTPVPYPAHFGTAAGLIGSVRDVAQYSMAIDRNAFLRATTQARVFTSTVSPRGDPLPYGLGWFVQRISGVDLQWHYGYWIGNSSLIIRVPDRGLVFVLLANSDGLSRTTSLGSGNLLSSLAAEAFLDTFVFGSATIPD
jgi:CubicO group peptidase (beta-lactamase class C family)